MAYQSQSGYHPISIESTKKLRFINTVFFKAKRVAASWKRWENKQEQNRTKEPEIFGLFHDKVSSYSWWLSTENEPKKGCVIGFAKDNGLGEKILLASRQARVVYPTQEEVEPFPFTETEIDELYKTTKAWMEKQ